MDNGIWIIFGLIAVFVLFCVGCALAESQHAAELDGIVGYKVTVRSKSHLPGKNYHEFSIYCGSLEECQEHLNSYSWPTVLEAWVFHDSTNTRWEANEVGVFTRIPPKVKVSA